jgi:2-polyprenyl-6-methoxyphenol hydroxylase-like FAD-dependent oxidoreductase
MMDRCKHDPLIDVRQGWRMETCAQVGDAVEATIINDAGEPKKIRASYLIGCDGASRRVRNELGIAMRGAQDISTFALLHLRSVVHEVEVSLFPNWVDENQSRKAVLIGRRLELSTTAPVPYGEEQLSAVLVWERA